jgi:hypothetical protein
LTQPGPHRRPRSAAPPRAQAQPQIQPQVLPQVQPQVQRTRHRRPPARPALATPAAVRGLAVGVAAVTGVGFVGTLDLRLPEAEADAVQRSAFPDAFARWEAFATRVVARLVPVNAERLTCRTA